MIINVDGCVVIMMFYLECVFCVVSNLWYLEDWIEDGVWMRLFRNVRVVLK